MKIYLAIFKYKNECYKQLERKKQIKNIHTSERSRYVLSENGIAFYAMTYCFGDIRV